MKARDRVASKESDGKTLEERSEEGLGAIDAVSLDDPVDPTEEELSVDTV